MLITFEGLDFCGKSTQARRLADRLAASARDVRVLREPGGTSIGETIRSLLLDRANTSLTNASELFLFSASRSQLVEEVIRPALAGGAVVILDRFFDSTTAYQGYGRGISLDVIDAVNRYATTGGIPDITFILDVPVAVIEERMRAAGTGQDRMESSGTAFYERVRVGYQRLAKSGERFRLLDGTKSIDSLHDEIWMMLQPMLAHPRGAQ